MTIPEIIESAAAHYGLPAVTLRGRNQSALKRRARDLAIRVLCAVTGLPKRSVGEVMACSENTVHEVLRNKISHAQGEFEKPVWQLVLTAICLPGENILAFAGNTANSVPVTLENHPPAHR